VKKTLTIIGAGWLASHFLNKYQTDFSFIITTSRQDKQTIRSHKHQCFDVYKSNTIELPNTNICLITLPFSRQLRSPNDYTKAIKTILNKPNKYDTIIFTSSTSIYKRTNALTYESSELCHSERAMALKDAENHILNQAKSVYILRLSGICGYTRNSMNKLKQDTISDANQPVNLIHASDINQIIFSLMNRKKIEKDILNVSCNEHPTKEAYYTYLCQLFDLTPPKFTHSTTAYKKISNDKLLSSYNIQLTYPSPLTFEFNHE
jgi:hypothetical protein